MEACEFWQTFCEVPQAKSIMPPFLPRIIPVLLKAMVYSEEDIAILDTPEVNDNVPDRPEDIRPRVHHPRQQAYHQSSKQAEDEEDNDENDEDSESESESDDDDDEVTEWTLRKCAAAGLDCIAGTFKGSILPILLPLIQEKLASQEWPVLAFTLLSSSI